VTHADIAKRLIDKLPPGVFAHAARDGVLHQDFVKLERMLPGVRFATLASGPGEWELAGTCEDGSTIVWQVGG